MAKEGSAEKVVKDIRRRTRRRFSAEEKVRIVGSRCPDTGKVYVPPRLFSVETGSPMSELVELPDRGVVYTYC